MLGKIACLFLLMLTGSQDIIQITANQKSILISSSPIGANNIYISNTPIGARCLHITPTSLFADVKIGFVKNPSEANLIISFSNNPFTGEKIYFSSSALGAISIYFSSMSLGTKSIYIADSGPVDLAIYIENPADITLEQFLAILEATGLI